MLLEALTTVAVVVGVLALACACVAGVDPAVRRTAPRHPAKAHVLVRAESLRERATAGEASAYQPVDLLR